MGVKLRPPSGSWPPSPGSAVRASHTSRPPTTGRPTMSHHGGPVRARAPSAGRSRASSRRVHEAEERDGDERRGDADDGADADEPEVLLAAELRLGRGRRCRAVAHRVLPGSSRGDPNDRCVRRCGRHHPGHEVGQLGDRVVGDPGVHGRGLHDRAARRDQPAEPLAGGAPAAVAGRVVAGAELGHRVEVRRALPRRRASGSSASARDRSAVTAARRKSSAWQ